MKLSVLVALCLIVPVVYARPSSAAVPEEAFVSPERYTNAFFGFSLPLPEEMNLRICRVKSSKINERHLFCAMQEDTVLIVSAMQMADREASRLAMAAPQVVINGRQFGKGLSDQKNHGADSGRQLT
jgi:hypothetical protein